MIPYFIFNNICSKDMGIVIAKLPPISKPERDIEEIDIPGKSGTLYIDNKCYRTLTYSIECTLMPEIDVRKISCWLNGFGKLTTSREPEKEYTAVVKNQIDFEQVYRIFNEFVIEFEVQPIAHSIEEKEINVTKAQKIFIEDSTTDILPYLKVIGNGTITITINNKNIILKSIEDFIEIDTEAEEAYKGEENCNNKIDCEEFPMLQPGENSISWIGEVENVYFRYKEAYI